MKKASKILGIVGGVIAILLALFAFARVRYYHVDVPAFIESSSDEEYYNETYQETYKKMFSDILGDAYTPRVYTFSEALKMVVNIFIGIGILISIAGILGIVSGAILEKSNIVAGVLMIIASIISLITVVGIIASPFLLLGGIFALIKDRSGDEIQVESKNENQ